MCQLINAACLLANVLEVFTTRDVLPLLEIRRIGDKIEIALRDEKVNVAVDWTRPSVMEAFALYSDLFVMVDGQVRKGGRFAEFSATRFVDDEFNHGLPPEAVTTMKRTIRESCIAA